MSKQLLIAAAMLAFCSFFIVRRRWMLTVYLISFSIPLDYGIYYFFEGYMGKSPADFRIAFIDFTFFFLFISTTLSRNSFRNEGRSVIRTNELGFLGAYLIFSFLSMLWAGNRILVIAEIVNLLKIVVVFLFFLRHSDFVYKNINYVIYGILGIVAIQFTTAVLQSILHELVNFDYLLGYDSMQIDIPWYRFGAVRVSGTVAGGPGALGIMMGVSSILGFSLMMLPRFHRIRRFGILIAVLATPTLLLSQGRTAIGGTFISVFFMFLIARKSIQIVKGGIILFGALMLIIFAMYENPMISATDALLGSKQSYAYRQILNINAIKLIRENPMIAIGGVGQNNYLDYQTKSSLPLPGRMLYLPVHNIYLFEFIEMGAIGMFFILGFFFLIAYHTYVNRDIHKDNSLKAAFMRFLFCFLIYCLFVGYFSWGIFLYLIRSYCFVILAITLCIVRGGSWLRVKPGDGWLLMETTGPPEKT